MSFLDSPNNPGSGGAPPALTDSAALYVTTGGNDSHDGLSWQTAKATLTAAIAALPAFGGIIELGYGAFTGFTLDANALPGGFAQGFAVHIRGRGIGQSSSVTDTSVAVPGRHPTRITSPCRIIGIGETAVTAGSNGVNVNTFAGAGVLNIASTSALPASGSVSVFTNGGYQSVAFTGKTANTLTGCTCAGAGVLATGNRVTGQAGIPESAWFPTILEDLAISGTSTTVAFTATVTNGQRTITALSSAAGLAAGDLITGSANLAIAGAATVNSVDGPSQITVEGPSTGTTVGVALTANKPALYIESANVCLRRVALDSAAGHGLVTDDIGNTFFEQMDSVRCLKNGGDGMHGTMQTMVCNNCNFDGNALNGWGAPFGSAAEIQFNQCTFQRNGYHGANVTTIGGVFIACQFEGNSLSNVSNYNGLTTSSSQTLSLIGCYFFGDNVEGNGIVNFAAGGNGSLNIIGCQFGFHVFGGVQLPFAGASTTLMGNFCAPGAEPSNHWLNLGAVAGGVWIPAAQSAMTIRVGNPSAESVYQQTLAASGAVAIDAKLGNIQQVTLGANATSSSIADATIGQELTIDWIQDATGTRTYVWPANCKFAGGVAPVASVTANYVDRVTFIYNGTNWTEKTRSIGIH